MQETDLITILKTFNQDELKEFGKLISSQFFNKGRNLLPYYNEILKILNHYDYSTHNQEYFHKKIYHSKPYNAKAKAYINKLNSELLKLTDFYFIYKFHALYPIKSKIAVYEILELKKLSTYSLKKINKSKKQIAIEFDTENFYCNQLLLNSYEASAFMLINRLKEYCNLFEERPLLITANFLVNFWESIIHEAGLLYQFNYEIKSINNLKKIINPETERKFIEILKNSNIPGFNNAIVFYNISLAYRELGNENLLNNAMNSVLNNLSNFELKTKFNLLLYIEGLIIFAEKILGKSWNSYRYKIIKTMIKNKILSHTENHIHYITYVNIIKFLINISQYSDAEHFINHYTNFLDLSLRNNNKNMALAWVNLAKKKFEKALEYNSKVISENFNQSTPTKIIELICFYELKDYNQALNACNRLKKYLSENKTINYETTKQYKNFINAINLLIELHFTPSNKNKKQKLDYLVNSNQPLYQRNWIKEKFEELNK
jgi:hypothetical protein